MTADTTRREHSGSGIRLGIGSCPGIAKILPEKGGPILAFTVTDLRIRDTDEARMLRAGRTHG